MPAETFEVISLAARYVFAFLGVIIVLRVFSWLRKDRREKHRERKNLPDAGMIGELHLLSSSGELSPGTVLPVPREGFLGCNRGNDLVLPCEGVSRRHLHFEFEDQTGLLIHPQSGQEVIVNGMILNCHSDSHVCPMIHGSLITVGSAVLRLHLFAGVNLEHSAELAYPFVMTPLPDESFSQPDTESVISVSARQKRRSEREEEDWNE